MIRTLGGIAAGLATAIVLMMIMEGLGSQVAPVGMNFDIRFEDEVTDPTPMLALLFPILGWLIGSLVGGWIAIRVSGRFWTAWAVAAVVFLATVVSFFFSPYPLWMIVAGAIAPLVGGYLAQKLAAIRDRRKGRVSE